MTAPRGASLTRRLVLAQSVVIAALTLTLLGVAGVVGPLVFDAHLHQAGHGDHPEVVAHAEEAFRAAGLTSLAAGTAVAVVVAWLVSVLLVRPLVRGLEALARGARRVAAGTYDDPVAVGGAGPELAGVAATFNDMADQIARTETTRRRMLTDLAHELRTPIAAVGVTLEAAEDGLVTPAEATATMRRSMDRLARLASDIAAVSAAEEGRLSLRTGPHQLADVVEGALAAARPACEARGVRLLGDVGEDVAVDVDPARLGQALDNVLRNAWQHTPVGRAVRVRVGREGREAVIEVADEGSGIDAADLPHVVERFYRAGAGRGRDDDTGTGVGLPIARAILAAHGGSLAVASDGLGLGTTVTMRLPVRGA